MGHLGCRAALHDGRRLDVDDVDLSVDGAVGEDSSTIPSSTHFSAGNAWVRVAAARFVSAVLAALDAFHNHHAAPDADARLASGARGAGAVQPHGGFRM